MPAREANSVLRLGITGILACAVALAGVVCAVVAEKQVSPGPARLASGSTVSPAPTSTMNANAVPALTGGGPGGWLLGGIGAASRRANAPQMLAASDKRECPAAAVACVDLTRHITWLQSGGKVSFGPVRMEPGKPGGGHETPRGTFHVAWKAGPTYMSTTYHEPMPWATFFAAGGIAFHGGSLTKWSHGCVHLTTPNAHYYNEHLPIGSEVVVF
ncbi:L,D-transpeptidase [Trebonia kvetii]|nr:L,D-transpeptidase [Trebonia kvetii]